MPRRCSTCDTYISVRCRSGMCTPCRKRKNYINNRSKYLKLSQERRCRNQLPKRTCSECDTALNRNNTTGQCVKHYRQVVSRDKKKRYTRAWYQRNGRAYYGDRYHNDIDFKINKILRARLNSAIKNNQKSGSAVRDLGCSIEGLKKHLESLFLPGMSWDNYGEWHIDHIRPLSSFDLSNSDELKKACNYANLQPLWAEDNLRKGNRYQHGGAKVV